jgi:hypothetical protein
MFLGKAALMGIMPGGMAIGCPFQAILSLGAATFCVAFTAISGRPHLKILRINR